jgi:hypothetical protein
MVSTPSSEVDDPMRRESTATAAAPPGQEGNDNGIARNIIDLEKQPNRSDEPAGGLTRGDRTNAQGERKQSAEKDNEWVVKWDGDDDPHDPLNTPGWKKWLVTSDGGCGFAYWEN